MSSSNSAAPSGSGYGDPSRRLATPEMIDRMATEMRARCAGELPQSFYAEQVKRRLTGRVSLAGDIATRTGADNSQEQPSVFHAWALRQ